MYSNRCRQGNSSRYANQKNVVQKPSNSIMRPTQILQRPNQVSPGEKLITLPILPKKIEAKSPTIKKKASSVTSNSIPSVIDHSPSTSKSNSSRRKPCCNYSGKSSPNISSSERKEPPSNSCSPEKPCAKPRSGVSCSQNTAPVDKKEEAAVQLLMVLLNSEDQQKISRASASSSSKLVSRSLFQEDKNISPQSLLKLLQPSVVPSVKETQRSPKVSSDNYYAAPLFRKPPPLSELPMPPFLAC